MPTPCQETTHNSTSSPSQVHIRRFEPGDEAGFLRLNEEWIVRYFVMEDADRETLGDPVRNILEPGGQILFAVVGQELVGCCALICEEPRTYLLAKMGVTQTYQGQGIGRRLLETAITEAREMGASRLWLESNTILANAIHLYESIGFRHVPADNSKPSPYSRTNVMMEMCLQAVGPCSSGLFL